MRYKVTILVLMLAIAFSIRPTTNTITKNIRTVSNIAKGYLFHNINSSASTRLSSLATATQATIKTGSLPSSTRQLSSLPQFFKPNIFEETMSPSATSDDQHPVAVPLSSTDSVKAGSNVEQPELPKLSAADFKTFNRLAVEMDYYHNHFRHTWKTLYTACEENKRPHGMTISQFLWLGSRFIQQLTFHHDIEEVHVFPMLARNMPEFRPKAAMVTQHKAIHDGLDRLAAYIESVKSGEVELRLQGEGSLKEVMDSFGNVLWTHLAEEVRNLGAENMRKYWTKSEISRMNL